MAKVSAALAAGLHLHRSGKLVEAEQSYARLLETSPDDADVLCLMGSVRLALGKPAMAVSDLREAIRHRAAYPEAHNNLGIGLTELGQLDDAAVAFRTALRLRPGYAEAHNNLGTVLRDQSKLDEAESCFREATRIKPGYAEALMNLGVALADRGEYSGAISCYEQSLQVNPSSAPAYMNLGNARRDRGEFDQADASYRNALRIQPDYAEAHYNRALGQLLRGDYEAGWQGYEWRFRCRSFPHRPFEQPTWDGSALDGRSILLHTEQGLGDVLQFIRYAPLVKERGGIVVVECPRSLTGLLEDSPGIDRLVAGGDPLPWFDVQTPLMSLPRLLKTTLATIPAADPYIIPNPARVARWRDELADVTGFKIGVCWQGNPKYPADRQRSFPLEALAPLARVPGVRLFSLQKGNGTEQLAALADRFTVIDLGPRLDESTGAFLDTAAVLKSFDLVVVPNTAIAHLAGAVGVPTWVALPAGLEWRWLVDRDDSPWYPTLRLFRRGPADGWNDVFERMAGELRRRFAPRGRSIAVVISPGELIDKITILQIKSERITDPGKLVQVRDQLDALLAVGAREFDPTSELGRLTAELKAINEAIWQTETEIRACEKAGDFGDRFIELARSVYRNNDRRAALKRAIDDHLGSSLAEVKSHEISDLTNRTRNSSP